MNDLADTMRGRASLERNLAEDHADRRHEVAALLDKGAVRIEELEAQLDDAHRHMREAGLPLPRTTSEIGTSEQGE